MSGGKPLTLPAAHSDPFVIDLGRRRRLRSSERCSDGGVYWAKNRAGKGKVPDQRRLRAADQAEGPTSTAGKFVREEDLTGPTSAVTDLGR